MNFLKGGAEYQCIVLRDAAWADYRGGFHFFATFGGYVAICAARGNHSIRTNSVEVCNQKRDHSIEQMRNEMEEHLTKTNVCNGEEYILMTVKGRVSART